jgi:signal transduction histidine kinase
LDLSKIEVDRMALDLEDISIDDLCRTCILFVRELALRKRIELNYAGPSHAQAMRADPRRLKQILINLLTNAVKFTPDGGKVSLEVQTLADAEHIEFTVQDTGIGIARADIGRLFQPFSQLDTDSDRRQEGTGLGLALVSRLAKLHGGSVTVESDGVKGKGSRFRVVLPLRAASASGAAAVAAPSSGVRTRAS